MRAAAAEHDDRQPGSKRAGRRHPRSGSRAARRGRRRRGGQVEQQQVGVVEVAEAQRVGRARRRQRVVAVGLEVVAEELQGGLVVLADDHRRQGLGFVTVMAGGHPPAGSSTTQVARRSRSTRLAGDRARAPRSDKAHSVAEDDMDRKAHAEGVNAAAAWDGQPLSRPLGPRAGRARAGVRRVAATGSLREATATAGSRRRRSGLTVAVARGYNPAPEPARAPALRRGTQAPNCDRADSGIRSPYSTPTGPNYEAGGAPAPPRKASAPRTSEPERCVWLDRAAHDT